MGPYTSKVQARKSLLHGGKKRKVVKTKKVKPPLPKGNPDSDAAKRRRADKRAAAAKPTPTLTPTSKSVPKVPVTSAAKPGWFSKIATKVARSRFGIPGAIITVGAIAVNTALNVDLDKVKRQISTSKKRGPVFDFPGEEPATKRKIKPTDLRKEKLNPQMLLLKALVRLLLLSLLEALLNLNLNLHPHLHLHPLKRMLQLNLLHLNVKITLLKR